MRARSLALLAVCALAIAGSAYVPYHYACEARARAALFESRWAHLRHDPASLERYRDDDERLRAAGMQPGRVVFLGASVTEGLDLPQWFPGAPFVNRGISGQLLWQELLRAPEDVFSLHPTTVVPEVCASNFESNAPPIGDTEWYLVRLVEAARAQGIRPTFATVLPVSRSYAAEQAPTPIAERIAEMNTFIRNYARAHGDPVIDWAAAVGDRDGYLPENLTVDGLHPNREGYARMAHAVAAVLGVNAR